MRSLSTRQKPLWARVFRIKPVVGMVTISVLAFLYLPIMILIVTSFSTGRVTEWPPPGYTLKWYLSFIQNPRALDSIRTSLLIASITSICTTCLGTLVSYGLTQFLVKRKEAINSLIYLPMIVSPLIIGISLLMFFHLVGLPLGYLSVIVAHMVRAVPFASLIMLTSFLGVRRSLTEAALDLGATKLSAFRRVILPTVLPGLMASALISFTISFDDISSTYFVIGGGLTTVQTFIFEQIEFVMTPEMNALTSAILVLSAILVTVAALLQRRQME